MDRRLLVVDLENSECSERVIGGADARPYIGGGGLAAHLFWRELAAGRPAGDPLYLMTGPLTGTAVPFTPRAVLAARSPLTGLWGEANFGGWFGAELRRCGFDGIAFHGRASEAAYLSIGDGTAEVRPAGDLWGLDTYEVTAALAGEGRVMAIGPAGENLVPYAAVVSDKGHVAGRTGMGAVMGAKRLKALVARGSGNAAVADAAAVAELRRRLVDEAGESLILQALSLFGTMAVMESGSLIGDVPMRNWSLGEWEAGLDKLGSLSYQETLSARDGTCFGCPLACKRKITLEGEEVPGPEYETVGTFGTMLLIDDLQAIARANDQCNRLGLDTITCGATIAFATECMEAGLLGPFQTGGIRLRWGDSRPVLEVLPLIARREGFGALLALGSDAMAGEVGGREFLTTVRKLEAPMHDPRALHGLGLAYATATRGACHVENMTLWLEQSASVLPEYGLEGHYTMRSGEGKAPMVALAQDIGQAKCSCAIVCMNGGLNVGVTDLCRALTAVTGDPYDPGYLRECGERVFLLKRCLNVLLGDVPENDRLPPRLTLRLEAGPTRDSAPDLEPMLAEWRACRGLDERGRPRRERLEGLGLGDLAGALTRPAGRRRPPGAADRARRADRRQGG